MANENVMENMTKNENKNKIETKNKTRNKTWTETKIRISFHPQKKIVSKNLREIKTENQVETKYLS